MQFDNNTGFLLLGEKKDTPKPHLKKQDNGVVKALDKNFDKQLDKLDALIAQNKTSAKEKVKESTRTTLSDSSSKPININTQKIEEAVGVAGEQYTTALREMSQGVLGLKDSILAPYRWLSSVFGKKKVSAFDSVHHTKDVKGGIYKAEDDKAEGSEKGGFLSKIFGSGFGLKKLAGLIAGGLGLKVIGKIFSKKFLSALLKRGSIATLAYSLVNSISDGMDSVKAYLGLSDDAKTTISQKLAGITTGIVNGVSTLLNTLSLGIIPKLDEAVVAKEVTDKLTSWGDKITLGIDNLTQNSPIVGKVVSGLLDVINTGMSTLGSGLETTTTEIGDIFTEIRDLFSSQSDTLKAWKKANTKWWEWGYTPDFMKSKDEKTIEKAKKLKSAKAIYADKTTFNKLSKKDQQAVTSLLKNENTDMQKNTNKYKKKKEDELAKNKKNIEDSKAQIKAKEKELANTKDPKKQEMLKKSIEAYKISIENSSTKTDTLTEEIKKLTKASEDLAKEFKDIKTNKEAGITAIDGYSGTTAPIDGYSGGNTNGFLKNLAKIESNNKNLGKNKNGYEGIYQFRFRKGDDGRKYLKKMGVSYQQWKQSPEIQQQMMQLASKDYAKQLKSKGIEPTQYNMWLRHNQGLGGAMAIKKGKLSPLIKRNIVNQFGAKEKARLGLSKSSSSAKLINAYHRKFRHRFGNGLYNTPVSTSTQNKIVKVTPSSGVKTAHQKIALSKKIKAVPPTPKGSKRDDTSKKDNIHSQPIVNVSTDSKELIDAIKNMHKTLKEQSKKTVANISKDTIIHNPLELALKDNK